jgi:hypothetical protein
MTEEIVELPAYGAPVPKQPREWINRWDADDFRLNGPLSVGGGLLRGQGAVARDLLRGHGLHTYIAGCGLLMVGASLLYGAILGSASGQVWQAALKFPVVIVGACGICLPSFYVFQALTGARLSLQQALAAVLMLGAAAGLILLGCAPIAWFFSVSTEGGDTFLGLMHAVIISISTLFGFHFLARTHRYIKWKHGERLFDGRVLALWCVLLLLVAAQMAHFIGPLDPDRGLLETERGFFLGALFES